MKVWLLLALLLGAPGAPLAAERNDRDDRRAAWTAPDNTVFSNTMVGARVQNREGKDLGEIERLVIDAKSGRVSHVVVGVGGVAGVGEKKLVVPWSAIAVGVDPSHARRIVATMDQRALDAAQRWEDPAQRRVRQDPASASPRTNPRVDRAPAPPGPGPRN
ncbi:MAG: PRC-barrel domain-containing protein [Candidatus Rokubacteria bacterium]|nr:PRC-barrel domain-containing protein [Candidatus Rokubacteria bacterium]